MPWKSRPCPLTGCEHVLTAAQRHCPDHGRQYEQVRGSRQQRGYDAEYDTARARALNGATHCVTCGQPFTDANPATGGHVIAKRKGGQTSDGIAAQCRLCNYGWRTTDT